MSALITPKQLEKKWHTFKGIILLNSGSINKIFIDGKKMSSEEYYAKYSNDDSRPTSPDFNGKTRNEHSDIKASTATFVFEFQIAKPKTKNK